MKEKNILLILFLLAGISVFSQTGTAVSNIPSNVENTFRHFYPNATNVTWEEEQGYFIPVFNNNNTITKLLIDLKGTLVHTSVQISAAAFPSMVSSYISTNFPGQAVIDAEQLTMINHSIRYEAVIGGKDLLFDSNGKFIRIVSGPLKQ